MSNQSIESQMERIREQGYEQALAFRRASQRAKDWKAYVNWKPVSAIAASAIAGIIAVQAIRSLKPSSVPQCGEGRSDHLPRSKVTPIHPILQSALAAATSTSQGIAMALLKHVGMQFLHSVTRRIDSVSSSDRTPSASGESTDFFGADADRNVRMET